jgi:uncharacterized protein YndB with AHSA1/START domain
MNESVTATGTDGLRLSRLLPGPIERVWTYLTDSQKRATWLAAGKFDLRLGGRIELQFDNDCLSPDASPPEKYGGRKPSFTGSITRYEPPRVLAFTWSGWQDPTEVTFELEPRGADVQLTITHVRLVDRGLRISVASGWDTHVSILDARLRGSKPPQFWPMHSRLEQEYGARL